MQLEVLQDQKDTPKANDATRSATRPERDIEGEVVTKRATILGSSNQK